MVQLLPNFYSQDFSSCSKSDSDDKHVNEDKYNGSLTKALRHIHQFSLLWISRSLKMFLSQNQLQFLLPPGLDVKMDSRVFLIHNADAN